MKKIDTFGPGTLENQYVMEKIITFGPGTLKNKELGDSLFKIDPCIKNEDNMGFYQLLDDSK